VEGSLGNGRSKGDHSGRFADEKGDSGSQGGTASTGWKSHVGGFRRPRTRAQGVDVCGCKERKALLKKKMALRNILSGSIKGIGWEGGRYDSSGRERNKGLERVLAYVKNEGRQRLG